MTPRPRWIDGRVDVLLAGLHDLGMSASRAAVAELIQERVRWVSAQAGISPTAARRYLTDEALTDLARAMVVALAPGPRPVHRRPCRGHRDPAP